MGEHLTTEGLAELRALCDAATPGPWSVKQVGPRLWSVLGPEGVEVPDQVRGGQAVVADLFVEVARSQPVVAEIAPGVLRRLRGPADAGLVAVARTAIPALVAEVERLRREAVDGAAWRQNFYDATARAEGAESERERALDRIVVLEANLHAARQDEAKYRQALTELYLDSCGWERELAAEALGHDEA